MLKFDKLICYDRAVRIFDRMSLTLPHFYATKKFNNNNFPAEQRAQSAVKKKDTKYNDGNMKMALLCEMKEQRTTSCVAIMTIMTM